MNTMIGLNCLNYAAIVVAMLLCYADTSPYASSEGKKNTKHVFFFSKSINVDLSGVLSCI